MRRALFIALCCVTGCDRSDAPNSPAPAPIANAALRVAADRPPLTDEPPGSISLSTTHFLFARLELPPSLPAPVAWVTVQLTAPSGAVHLERNVPIAIDPSVTEAESHHGVGHAIHVTRAEKVPGGYAIEVPILVGGSNLQRRPQPGDWTLTATLEGHPEIAAKTVIHFVR
jgi:hypothetical protein